MGLAVFRIPANEHENAPKNLSKMAVGLPNFKFLKIETVRFEKNKKNFWKTLQ